MLIFGWAWWKSPATIWWWNPIWVPTVAILDILFEFWNGDLSIFIIINMMYYIYDICVDALKWVALWIKHCFGTPRIRVRFPVHGQSVWSQFLAVIWHEYWYKRRKTKLAHSRVPREWIPLFCKLYLDIWIIRYRCPTMPCSLTLKLFWAFVVI